MIRRIIVFLLYVVLILFLINKLTDPDLWWHLKSGQYILENKVIPKTDVFSYTGFQNEWIDLHWFFQVTIYSLYKYIGANSVIFLQVLIITLVFSLFFWLKYDKRSCLLSAIIFLVVIFVCEERFLVRPEMFTMLFIGIYLFILDRYKNSNKDYLWFIPVLQVIWVNMHGLFVLGPVLILAYFFGELLAWKLRGFFSYGEKNIISDRRYLKLLLVTGLTVCVCFVNPYGYRGVVFPYELFQKISPAGDVFSKDIFEFQRPFSIHPASIDIQLYKVVLFLSLFSFLVAVRKIKLSIFFVYLLFLCLSLLARRNINFFVLVAGMATVDNLRDLSIKYDIEKKLSVLYIPLFLGLVLSSVSIVTDRFYLYSNSIKRFGLGISDLIYSDKACAFIKESKLPGNILNDLGSGGYLIWQLFPEKKVFIDGRLEVYDYEFYNLYNSLFFDYPLFKQAVEHYDIDYVVWNYNLPFMPGQFLDNIVKDIDWKLACIDNSFMVFLRNKPGNNKVINKGFLDYTTELINHHLGHEWRGVFFDQTLKLPEMAANEYKRAIKLEPGSYIARNNLGNFYIGKGLYEQAARELEIAVKLKPDNAGIYTNLGIAYNAAGKYDKAIKIFQKGLRVAGEIPQLWFNLGSVYEQRGFLKKAVQCYRKAVELNPEYSKAKAELERILDENSNNLKL
jgi:tetratricopeptide (TPR) repeat protein